MWCVYNEICTVYSYTNLTSRRIFISIITNTSAIDTQSLNDTRAAKNGDTVSQINGVQPLMTSFNKCSLSVFGKIVITKTMPSLRTNVIRPKNNLLLLLATFVNLTTNHQWGQISSWLLLVSYCRFVYFQCVNKTFMANGRLVVKILWSYLGMKIIRKTVCSGNMWRTGVCIL